jgi:methionyl-tRNA formyltransferase
MRIVFMGSPDFAVPSLNALVEAGHEVVAAYCQPPRPAGRGNAERKTAVHQRAEELGIAVRAPKTLRDADEQERFRALEPDLAVVAAYGLILPRPILGAPRMGCINVHASLLPRWRGAAPIQRAILAGDEETGITIMQMEEALDTGPILLSESTRCAGKFAGYLERELSKLGAKLLLRYLRDPAAYPPRPQPAEGVTYAQKVRKEELRIDFRNTADFIDSQIDAFNPPGAYFEYRGERIRVLRADWEEVYGRPGEVLDDELLISCNAGSIRPIRVQRAGRSEMSLSEFLRGFPIPEGTILK